MDYALTAERMTEGESVVAHPKYGAGIRMEPLKILLANLRAKNLIRDPSL
jgi:hypothetical protein